MSKNRIVMIPVDQEGNKLFLKEFRKDGDNLFVKFKSTYNDIPFLETELVVADGGKNLTIVGDDGTVLYRFAIGWLENLI